MKRTLSTLLLVCITSACSGGEEPTSAARQRPRSEGNASASGVARVVIAARDPHPFAAGVGIERLQAAGIEVECGVMGPEARAQNSDFFARWDKS